VGTDFKVSFFKRFLNFYYDKVEGIIYCSDLVTLEKLGIDKQIIKNVYVDKKIDVVNTENENKINTENDNKIELLNKQVLMLIDNNKKLESILKCLVDYQKELLEQDDDKEKYLIEKHEVFKNSIVILSKKIKKIDSDVENLNVRFEAIIDLFSDEIMNNKINIFSSGITIEKIWNATKNKKDAAVLCIMHMIKKTLEDKGTRF